MSAGDELDARVCVAGKGRKIHLRSELDTTRTECGRPGVAAPPPEAVEWEPCKWCHRLWSELRGRGPSPAERAAAAWNTAHPIGTPVVAYPGARSGRAVEGETRSPAWVLPSGAAVVLVTGLSGGIALDHVDPVTRSTRGVRRIVKEWEARVFVEAAQIAAAWGPAVDSGEWFVKLRGEDARRVPDRDAALAALPGDDQAVAILEGELAGTRAAP